MHFHLSSAEKIDLFSVYFYLAIMGPNDVGLANWTILDDTGQV